MSEITSVTPAIYKFSNIPWGWVDLHELAQIVDGRPHTVWEWYFSLSKDADILAVVMKEPEGYEFKNVDIEGYIFPGGEKAVFPWAEANAWRQFLDATTDGMVFVPAGWAHDVIKQWKWETTGVCEHSTVERNDYRVGCSDAGCDMRNNHHFCHTVIEEICDRCGEVLHREEL